ncbi:MAG TPA: SIR2 family protein [Aggregatilineaceae bacterium]|nr:SIR2 family protein [Aggregatilineaceae bacterium]
MPGSFNGITHLKRVYHQDTPDNSFGLYLGAGVNLPTESIHEPTYRTYGWEGLIKALYEKNMDRLTVSFSELWNKYRRDWPCLSREVCGSLPVERFVDQLDEIIYDAMPRGDKYARLSKKLLHQAPTLHAALCFSTKIRQRTPKSWTFERNAKIATVITPNYDYFFGAGWTRYEAFADQWKVTTFLSDRALACVPGTINYIHGYLPYSRSQKQEIVLTDVAYKAAYNRGFAQRALHKGLNEYTLIFLGTSFTDVPLCKMLRKVKGQRQHFAVVTGDMAQRCEDLGVVPVIVPSFEDIATVLEEVYCAALDPVECQRVGLPGPHAYWERLWQGKDRQERERDFGKSSNQSTTE